MLARRARRPHTHNGGACACSLKAYARTRGGGKCEWRAPHAPQRHPGMSKSHNKFKYLIKRINSIFPRTRHSLVLNVAE